MRIEKITERKKRFLELLLLGDEQEDMIDRYLERGEVFALFDPDLKSICVVTDEGNATCELKNLATYAAFQGRGYGTRLVEYLFRHYHGKYAAMVVGTGEVPGLLAFYERLGFRFSHRLKNFFTVNYREPIVECGVRLVDMICLKKSL
ncbi:MULTISPECIES: GNAT family N-acetyltransferase [unclassified Desulfovibrio]|uniref:GNAT family N-acetyltransferase n=1 Tax=unclassified Desulfovibrio TaxID=2593640 RepID=UPI0013EA03F6|nr:MULTISPECIES: GNAT family N-acetyltransferase [unclassified Desulfovibrio]